MLTRTSGLGSEPRTVGTLAGTDEFDAGGTTLGIGTQKESIAILIGEDQSPLMAMRDQPFGEGSNRSQVIPDSGPVNISGTRDDEVLVRGGDLGPIVSWGR